MQTIIVEAIRSKIFGSSSNLIGELMETASSTARDDDFRRTLLRRIFEDAVESVHPANCLAPHLPHKPRGRLIVTGAGKAAAAMAQSLENHWKGPLSGAVVTRHGYGLPTRQIEILESGHPVPDEHGVHAAQRMLELAQSAGPDDLVIFLLSGGGSALMVAPAPGLTLADKQNVTKALLACGATISEINCVRKHISAVKGGRLATAAFPAKVLTLAISDVPGDDPAIIASGPTVADPTTFGDAASILQKYSIDQPRSVLAHLSAARNETPKPGAAEIAQAEYRIIARPKDLLERAKSSLTNAGFEVRILGDDLQGEAREVAAEHAELARLLAQEENKLAILSGGECTVSIVGNGSGGPNREYALALALSLNGHPRIAAIACDSDGADGAPNPAGEDVAGAVIDSQTLLRAETRSLDTLKYLHDNDAGAFFEILGDSIVTGPTYTNVNDFRCILID